VFLSYPVLAIDLEKIKINTRAIVTVCDEANIETVGVVKACLGSIDVAEAMVAGGAAIIGDSRLSNLKRLRAVGVPLMMLRQPMLSEIKEAVLVADYFLVSEMEAVRQLALEFKRVADSAGKITGKPAGKPVEDSVGECAIRSTGKHTSLKPKVILMVELGDLREGIMPEDVDAFAETVIELDGVELVGLGANVACLQGVPPTPEMLDKLAHMAEGLRNRLGIELPVVSGGNSSAWKLLAGGSLPEGINQLRFGEGILLGQETIDADHIDGTFQDAVVLSAEIIEIKDKPFDLARCFGAQNDNVSDERQLSARQTKQEKIGKTGKRAILAIGSQDISVGTLRPLDSGIEILRRSSDHLVVGIDNANESYSVGNCIDFIPSYEALLAAMTSPFVEKRFCWNAHKYMF
jgi:predicted amino acid racemase